MTATETTRRPLRMTAGFWARGVAQILSSPNTTNAERERIIGEMRAIAQAAADAGLVDLIPSGELDGNQR